ncbi:MAG: alkaline phosphatase family protein, partial [Candidatus Aminicenantes bacterium]|nr:alkaline phosphatase family protein [Candidatus Aminicenantes bacterium]
MSRMNRREFLKRGLAASSLLAAGSGFSPLLRAAGKRATQAKVLILGFDGLDPNLIQRWLSEGKLPSFARLIKAGGFRPLGTSLPPQSPVAWSNFITGTDPGGHGIFDFMHRDPNTYIPTFSGTLSTEAKKTFKVGDFVLPLSGGEVKNLIQAKAFWQILEEHDIPATVFKMPSNYPPVSTKQRTLSGMGTPDLKGSYGISCFYTTDPAMPRGEVSGGRIYEVYVIGNRVEAKLPGPVNTFKKDRPEAVLDFQVHLDPVHPVAKIVLPDQEFILKEREWSGWKRVRFGLMPTQSVSGICMFYLKEIRPHFKLYVSPINIDPAHPAQPISTPGSYAQELERIFGPFFTKGLPADTSALDNDFLDEEEFLEQDEMILREREQMFDYEFERFSSGLLFYYVSSTDQRQHMFWRLLDKSHSEYDPRLAARFGRTIEDIYIKADRLLGRILPKIDKETVIMIMSDHGF